MSSGRNPLLNCILSVRFFGRLFCRTISRLVRSRSARRFARFGRTGRGHGAARVRRRRRWRRRESVARARALHDGARTFRTTHHVRPRAPPAPLASIAPRRSGRADHPEGQPGRQLLPPAAPPPQASPRCAAAAHGHKRPVRRAVNSGARHAPCAATRAAARVRETGCHASAL